MIHIVLVWVILDHCPAQWEEDHLSSSLTALLESLIVVSKIRHEDFLRSFVLLSRAQGLPGILKWARLESSGRIVSS